MGSRFPFAAAGVNTPEAHTVLWEALCEDPAFANLPYKVETNERGQLLMSPAQLSHSAYQADFVRLLYRHAEAVGLAGRVLTEAAVSTSGGIKVPDVVWVSSEEWNSTGRVLFTRAPSICVEVLSPSNSSAEMAEKRALYFAAGAKEVWICAEDGAITFHNAAGEAAASQLMPGFPHQIALT